MAARVDSSLFVCARPCVGRLLTRLATPRVSRRKERYHSFAVAAFPALLICHCALRSCLVRLHVMPVNTAVFTQLSDLYREFARILQDTNYANDNVNGNDANNDEIERHHYRSRTSNGATNRFAHQCARVGTWRAWLAVAHRDSGADHHFGDRRHHRRHLLLPQAFSKWSC